MAQDLRQGCPCSEYKPPCLWTYKILLWSYHQVKSDYPTAWSTMPAYYLVCMLRFLMPVFGLLCLPI